MRLRRAALASAISIAIAACSSFGSSPDDTTPNPVDGGQAGADATSTPPGVPPPPAPPPLDGGAEADVVVVRSQHRVFITSLQLHANIGLGGFDVACNQAGSKIDMKAKWAAWISTTSVKAIDHVGHVGPWVVAFTNQPIAVTEATLTSGALINGIDRSELNGQITGQSVFTGTSLDGTWSGNSCGDWTLNDTASKGTRGISGHKDATWTAAALGCDMDAHIYCFEL
jgi:hypothetical protein